MANAFHSHSEEIRYAGNRFVSSGVAERAWEALLALGAADVPHVSAALATHLRGTAALLATWGGRDALCLGGLYHAVYGTAGFRHALASLAARSRIAQIIGAEAEAIAYRHGACDRGVFHPRIGGVHQLRFADRFTGSEYAVTERELRDFCELTLANELELAVASASFWSKHRAALCELFERMRPSLSAAAVATWRSVCDDDTQKSPLAAGFPGRTKRA